jgi:hypothetical protein
LGATGRNYAGIYGKEDPKGEKINKKLASHLCLRATVMLGSRAYYSLRRRWNETERSFSARKMGGFTLLSDFYWCQLRSFYFGAGCWGMFSGKGSVLMITFPLLSNQILPRGNIRAKNGCSSRNFGYSFWFVYASFSRVNMSRNSFCKHR